MVDGLDEKCAYIDYELQGKIFLIQKDVEGNVLSRNELNGEVMLKIFAYLIDHIDNIQENILNSSPKND